MATAKVTFTLDQATTPRLQEGATHMTIPKSEVVRVAIAEYYERIGRLSKGERLRLLRAFDNLVPRIAASSAAKVDSELRSVRRARRAGGRRHTS